MSNREIRQKAREQLGNQIFGETWLLAIVVLLIESAILGAVSFTGIGSILLMGPLAVGVSGIFLSLARGGQKVKIEDTFKGFNQFSDNLLIGLMTFIFTTLWSLLFIIPGIVKSYSYSMAYYIKNDNPSYTWKECIDESRRMMDGNKASLFLLDLSFIGWIIVGSLCFGVGTLWVSAYMSAARANFYEQIR